MAHRYRCYTIRMSDDLPPSKFGAGYTVGGDVPRPASPQLPSPQPPQTFQTNSPFGASPPPPPSEPPSYPAMGYGAPSGYGLPPSAPAYGAPTSNLVATFRSNKLILHTVAGALSGAFGAILANAMPETWPRSQFQVAIMTGLWFAIITSIIATALFVSDSWHQRRGMLASRIALTWLSGAGAGFLAGAIAQYVYTFDIGSLEFKNYVFRTFCWGLAGALVGGLLSRTVPNLSFIRGSAAGFIGGCLGGICFILISDHTAVVWGRIFGVAILGLALGLAMYVVEKLFSAASLEIVWGPNETSQVALGPQPITVGGDVEDDVFVRGLPPNVSSIVLRNGQIEHIENYSGQCTPMGNGSQLQVGPIQLIVHARQ